MVYLQNLTCYYSTLFILSVCVSTFYSYGSIVYLQNLICSCSALFILTHHIYFLLFPEDSDSTTSEESDEDKEEGEVNTKKSKDSGKIIM